MAGRMSVTASVDVARKPDEVFAYLSDVSKHGEWSPKAYRTEGLEPGPVKAGDAFTSYGVIPGDKQHRNEVTVTEVSAPSRLVLTSKEKDQHFINTFDLQQAGDGTRVSRTMDMPMPGFPLSALMPLLKVTFIKPDVQKGLNKLKGNLEGR